MSTENRLPACAAMVPDCAEPVTMIGHKGYAYCTSCGATRRQSGAERVRKMTPAELRKIAAGILFRY